MSDRTNTEERGILMKLQVYFNLKNTFIGAGCFGIFGGVAFLIGAFAIYFGMSLVEATFLVLFLGAISGAIIANLSHD